MLIKFAMVRQELLKQEKGMYPSYLMLRFRDDADGTGRLSARAQADGFAGEAGAYFGVAELEAFAAAIAAYPLPKDNYPSVTGGFLDGRGGLLQEHLSLFVFPIDAQGHLCVRVRMATEVWEQARPEPHHSAQVEVLTTYEPLAQFSRALVALVRGTVDEAILEGENECRK
jgi:hypothetical protein